MKPMTDEYIRKEDAVGAVEFGITLASAINTETGEWTELFQRENDELREAVKRIKDITPVDVVPVRHGKWISDVFCSECGWINEVEPGFIGGTKGFNFCPNCGADMRGDEHD